MLRKEFDALERNLACMTLENLLEIVSSSLTSGDFTCLDFKKTSIGSSCFSASGFFNRGWAVLIGNTENLRPLAKDWDPKTLALGLVGEIFVGEGISFVGDWFRLTVALRSAFCSILLKMLKLLALSSALFITGLTLLALLENWLRMLIFCIGLCADLCDFYDFFDFVDFCDFTGLCVFLDWRELARPEDVADDSSWGIAVSIDL